MSEFYLWKWFLLQKARNNLAKVDPYISLNTAEKNYMCSFLSLIFSKMITEQSFKSPLKHARF